MLVNAFFSSSDMRLTNFNIPTFAPHTRTTGEVSMLGKPNLHENNNKRIEMRRGENRWCVLRWGVIEIPEL